MKYDDIIAAFGARIRDLRIKHGDSQEAFAQECEIDRSYYGRIERCMANPTLKNIAAIADALGIQSRISSGICQPSGGGVNDNDALSVRDTSVAAM